MHLFPLVVSLLERKYFFPNDVDLYLKQNLRNPLQKHCKGHMGSSLAVVEDAVLSSFLNNMQCHYLWNDCNVIC